MWKLICQNNILWSSNEDQTGALNIKHTLLKWELCKFESKKQEEEKNFSDVQTQQAGAGVGAGVRVWAGEESSKQQTQQVLGIWKLICQNNTWGSAIKKIIQQKNLQNAF